MDPSENKESIPDKEIIQKCPFCKKFHPQFDVHSIPLENSPESEPVQIYSKPKTPSQLKRIRIQILNSKAEQNDSKCKKDCLKQEETTSSLCSSVSLCQKESQNTVYSTDQEAQKNPQLEDIGTNTSLCSSNSTCPKNPPPVCPPDSSTLTGNSECPKFSRSKKRNKFLYSIRGTLRSLESILNCFNASESRTKFCNPLTIEEKNDMVEMKETITSLEPMLDELMKRYNLFKTKELCVCEPETSEIKEFEDEEENEKEIETLEEEQIIETNLKILKETLEHENEKIIEKTLEDLHSQSSEQKEKFKEFFKNEHVLDTPNTPITPGHQIDSFESTTKVTGISSPFHLERLKMIRRKNALKAEKLSKSFFEDIYNNRITELYPDLFPESDEESEALLDTNINHSKSLLRLISNMIEKSKVEKSAF